MILKARSIRSFVHALCKQMSLLANECVREFTYKSFSVEKKEEESVKIKIIDVSTLIIGVEYAE